jgi:hypothetical protein
VFGKRKKGNLNKSKRKISQSSQGRDSKTYEYVNHIVTNDYSYSYDNDYSSSYSSCDSSSSSDSGSFSCDW